MSRCSASAVPQLNVHVLKTPRVIVSFVIALVVCTVAEAQTGQGGQSFRPERPYRGLFGGNAADPNRNQNLDLTVSFYGAYDDNVLAGRGQGGSATGDPRFQQSGEYAGGDLSLAYGRHGERGTVNVSGGTSYRYYPSIHDLSGFNYFGTLGFSLKITSRTTLRATESVTYSPYYGFGSSFGLSGQVPGELITATTDYSIVERPAVTYFSSAAIDHRLTRRATVTADYRLRYTDFREEGDSPLRDWGAGARFSYDLTRRARARLGYHYRRAVHGMFFQGRPIEYHDVDVGVDYDRALSISRRTTFGFTTGTGVYRSFDPGLEEEPTPGSTQDLRLRTRFLFTGSAYLNREFGRTWNARLDYKRGLHYIEGFPDAFFSDAVSFNAAGQAGRRARIAMSAAYNDGQMGIASLTGRNYELYTGTAGVQFAVTRMTALYVNYLYYHYEFDEDVRVPFGMARGLDRHSVRAGLTLWLPLLR